ncbi:SubName: Full=Uncharacterized protein {ECO:0000313/EMBL:CCA69593.1} [Serendipita indica DSM 11827]|uniref:Uncharacterized protein n=1 Tax=Serendipita indica (strain DSM 11827) TaxID=1109443 RepID=G4TE39_SERID|nr:SubName: Full=Uncharacterized protein {ECO:0000313/EMBL:CCA69593.1} [Serendipita indica DSM 11827]CCA69593.1 hypothetical protein PIIN_03532 [Serendipita indica DSM 11827]
MMFKLSTALAVAVAAAGTNALSVLVPNSQWWWQRNDQALLSWDCTDKSHPTFSVVAINSNVTLLSAGLSVLVGQQDNTMCTTNILPDLIPGKGYRITLTNIVNYTDIYATSEEFEVHEKGTPYPSVSASTIPGASAPATGSAASASATAHSGASSAQVGLSVGGVLALTGIITAALGA